MKSKFRMAALAIGQLIASQALLAQIHEVEEVVVKELAPVAEKSAVSEEEIEDYQANDLEDVFRHSPDVTVGGSQASAQKVYVRGVEDTNLNVTVDGARQSGYLFHHQGRLQVSPELLKRVEVKYGASVLLGPGALGGAVQMETKDSSDLLRAGEDHGQLLKLDYSTNANGKGVQAAAYGKARADLGYLVYGTYRDLENYEAGGGDEIPYTSARPSALLAKLDYTPGRHKAELSFETKKNNAKRSLRNHFGDYGFNPASRQDFTSDNTVFNYSYAGESLWINPSVKLFHTNYLLRRYGESDSETTWETNGMDVRNLAVGERHEWTFGLDLNKDKSFAKSSSGDNQEVGEIFGVFEEIDYQITRGLKGRFGLRYDHFLLESVDGSKIAQNHISPALALMYSPGKMTYTASWAQAFKGAAPMESLLISSATAVENRGELEGTTANTAQLSAQFDNKTFSAGVALYRTEFQDTLQVERDRNTGVITRFNGDNLISSGATLNSQAAFGAWQVGGSFATNKIEYDGESLGYFAFNRGNSFGDRLNLFAQKSFMDKKLDVRASLLKTFEMRDVPSGAKPQPGYEVTDLSFVYHHDNSTDLSLAITNLFDEKYLAHGTPYIVSGEENSLYEQGRDVRVEVKRLF